MYTVDKIQRGAARYIEAELLPKAEGKDKWVLGSISTLLLARLPAVVTQLKASPMVNALGIVADDGTVDLDALVASLKPSARQSPAKIAIPLGGVITLTEKDLDTLHNYINQA